MTNNHTREIFLNLLVRDLERAKGLFALSCESRAEVDEMVRKAVAAGATRAMDPIDHGFMHGWSFYDLDGHHWEVLWMDPRGIEQ